MKNKSFIYANILILAGFTIWFLLKGNYEFLMYTATMGLLIYAIARTDRMFNYSAMAKSGFTVWLFLHLSGGSFYFNGIRLYNIVLLPLIGEPYNILRYDQLMHILIVFILTLFIYSMISSFAEKKTKPILIAVSAILAGTGLGSLNEIIEFSTVILFSSTGVGNYYNNALDIVFNFIGALLALFFMKNKKKVKRK